jgi:hypothetical protein
MRCRTEDFRTSTTIGSVNSVRSTIRVEESAVGSRPAGAMAGRARCTGGRNADHLGEEYTRSTRESCK